MYYCLFDIDYRTKILLIMFRRPFLSIKGCWHRNILARVKELHLIIDEGAEGSHFSAWICHSQNIFIIRHVRNQSNNWASYGSVIAFMIEDKSDIRCATWSSLGHLPFKKWPQRSLAERFMLIFCYLQLSKLPFLHIWAECLCKILNRFNEYITHEFMTIIFLPSIYIIIEVAIVMNRRGRNICPSMDLFVVKIIENDISMNSSSHILVIDLCLLKESSEGDFKCEVDRGLNLI